MSTVIQHPDAQLTVRQAYERHYFKDRQCSRTEAKFRHFITTWETLSGNPPIGDITDGLAEEFRTKAIEQYAPATVMSVWKSIKAILRRMGPRETGNPSGLNVIPLVPYMRPVRLKRRRPRRVHLDDISRVYVQCRKLEHPHRGYCSPCEWWRALLVTAYVTGFRRSDLFNLDWEDIDLDELTIDFQSLKTEKDDLFPLHPVAAEHLIRIRDPKGGRVFKAAYASRSGSLYKVFKQLCDDAGVGQFRLHDIRRTAASEIEGVSKGMAAVFLQHAPRDVTTMSYVNRHTELREVIERMPLPVGFKAGPKSQVRREEKARKERVQIRLDELSVPTGPNPAEWDFRYGHFSFRGFWFPMESPLRHAILKLLVTSDGPVHYRQLQELADKLGSNTDPRITVSSIRQRLRKCLGLGSYDPIPCVSRGDGGAWTITVP